MGRARAFYGGLFGWDIQEGPPEAGGYSMATMGGHQVAGIGPKMSEEMPTAWITYIATDDADATAAKIKAAGGQMLMDPFDVMDVGRMGIAVDPGGAVFGLWQSRTHTGVGRANEPGALAWNENMSRDYERNKEFYRSVFGYDFGDVGADTYQTLQVDGKEVAGIGAIEADTPPDTPANWGVYFAVADTDAAAAKLNQLGGSVIRGPWDSPFGRMAQVSDDQGAVFYLGSLPQG
jgi:predicted enzyme related to lactoylglutathione lyase